MSWQQLLADRKVQAHVTSKAELDDLRAVVARDLADASITALSSDRRFATAYNAALQAMTMAMACSGYRTTGVGHHKTAIEALPLCLGQQAVAASRLFETSRRKRNTLDYDRVGMASATEADQLVQEAGKLLAQVETWIAQNYPHLV